jgi:hypothetical protein
MERIKVELTRDLSRRVAAVARAQGATPQAYVLGELEKAVPALQNTDLSKIESRLPVLVSFLERLPSVSIVSSGKQSGYWWVKFNIDLESPLAWSVVQALGFVLNFISLTQLLPTVFKPVSPPPYLNGGPFTNLSWVIEATTPLVDPAGIAAILEERLPSPVEDLEQWRLDPE